MEGALPGQGSSQAAVKRNKNKQPVGPGWLFREILASLIELFLEQFSEHGVNILLIANMLHGEVVESRLQVFVFTPQRLMRPAGDFNIAVAPSAADD